MQILPFGYFLLAVLGVLCFCKLKDVAYTMVFTAPLTTMSVFALGDSNILFNHLLFVILLIKTVLRRKRLYYLVPRSLSVFMLWCLCSIPIAAIPFINNIKVYNVDGYFEHVKFSFQQFTQYGYLLVSFGVCVIMASLLKEGVIEERKLIKVFAVSYMVEMLLTLGQIVLPVELVNFTYRNAVGTGYNLPGARISGSFGEPSFWAAYATAGFCVFANKLIEKPKIKYIISVVLFVLCFINNKSSSAIVGMAAWLAIGLIRWIKGSSKRVKRISIVVVLVAFIALIAFLYTKRAEMEFLVTELGQKLRRENESGTLRSGTMLWHFGVFFTRPLTGVGYGTVRSLDLMTTYLAELGIFGFLCYVVPVFRTGIRMLKKKENRQIGYYILIYNIIMFLSVPEPYFYSIWIAYALAFYHMNKKALLKGR